jgi:hypothetical protein
VFVAPLATSRVKVCNVGFAQRTRVSGFTVQEDEQVDCSFLSRFIGIHGKTPAPKTNF